MTLATLPLVACDGGGSATGQFGVDQNLAPTSVELRGFDEDNPRPVEAIYDHEADMTSQFVANELVVVTDDEEELNAIMDALNAERLATFDPSDIGLPDHPPEHLLRVDPSDEATSGLANRLERLGEEFNGDFSASSPDGLRLLALAARQREAGHRVSPNWVGKPNGFTDGVSLESDSGSAPENVFDWPSHGRDTTQDIDVVTAWQMLERTVDADAPSDIDLAPGAIKIAIMDGGFSPDTDFVPNGYILPFWTAVNPLGFDPVDTENLGSCGDGNPCPWHGTKVASAALAVPDNEYGSAGPAGPIADPLFITTEYDRFSTLLGFDEAVHRGARVLNMSYSMWGPRFWAKAQGLRGELDAYTRSLRNRGILVFASTPNNGRDFGSAPLRTFHVAPCHNAKVICVSGLQWDSTQRAANSSYGGGVDISAPYTLWVGPTPDLPAQHRASGNSYAAPFTAGVAALVMHANPDLSADEVETILMDTAHDSPDPQIPRYINAAGAVREALVQGGYEPIRLTIISPEEGETIARGTGITLIADALDLDDGVPEVEWQIEGGPVLGSGATVTLGPGAFESAGDYTLVATATAENGTVTDEVSVTVVDNPPDMEITQPGDGAVFTEDETITLTGTSYSSSDLSSLPDEDVAWYLNSAPTAFAMGHEATLDLSGLTLGTHDLRFEGTVGDETGQDQIGIEIIEGGDDPPPSVEITSPDNGATFNADEMDGSGTWYKAVTLSADVSDNEPLDTADIVWTTSIDDGVPQELGTGTTLVDARLEAPECFGNSHRITLTVTDGAGQTRSYSISVTVSLLC